jgi:hypothetical protein
MQFRILVFVFLWTSCGQQDPDIVNVTVNNYACCDAGSCSDGGQIEPDRDAGTRSDAGADPFSISIDKQHSGPRCDAYQVRTREDRANLYIVLDRSTSMAANDEGTTSRMERALLGMDAIAQSHANRARLGFSTYPCSPPGTNTDAQINHTPSATWAALPANQQNECLDLNVELLTMGQHTIGDVMASYQNAGAGVCDWNAARTEIHDNAGVSIATYDLGFEDDGHNGTPTGAALYKVLNDNLTCDQSITGTIPCSQQQKNVVLITDGAPCRCGDGYSCSSIPTNTQATATAAQTLRAQNISTYVVGFAGVLPSYLDVMALAGGTDLASGGPGPLEADDPVTLASAFDSIVASVQCSMHLDNAPNPLLPNETLVTVDGVAVPANGTNGYTYNSQTQTIYLHGTSCQQLVDNDAAFAVWMGCEGGVSQAYTSVSLGDYFQYEINVTTSGTAPNGRIVVTDNLPPCLQVINLPTSGWYCTATSTPAGQLVSCEADPVPAPGPLVLTVQAVGRCGERIRNCATAGLGPATSRDCDDLAFGDRRSP